MRDFKIRRGVAADDRVLSDLDLRTWAPEGSVMPRPRPGARFFGPATSPDQILVAARRKVIGYVRLVQPVPFPSGIHVRQIQGLAVDPAEQGRGVGRALVDAACAEALRQGAWRVTLRVLSTNATARRLYESAGFAVEGVLPGEFHIEGAYVDDVLMGRRVG